MVTRDTVWPEGAKCRVDLGVSDIPKAISFYSGLSDWDIPRGTPETGGRMIREPADSPYGRTATVTDDQGAVFSLISMPPGD
jgi:hypothetical protein